MCRDADIAYADSVSDSTSTITGISLYVLFFAVKSHEITWTVWFAFCSLCTKLVAHICRMSKLYHTEPPFSVCSVAYHYATYNHGASSPSVVPKLGGYPLWAHKGISLPWLIAWWVTSSQWEAMQYLLLIFHVSAGRYTKDTSYVAATKLYVQVQKKLTHAMSHSIRVRGVPGPWIVSTLPEVVTCMRLWW